MLCDCKKEDLDFDLDLVSKMLKEDESYGLRNIHDRIHFLFTYSKLNFYYFFQQAIEI